MGDTYMAFKLKFTFGIEFRSFNIADNTGSFNRINLLQFLGPRNCKALNNNS